MAFDLLENHRDHGMSPIQHDVVDRGAVSREFTGSRVLSHGPSQSTTKVSVSSDSHCIDDVSQTRMHSPPPKIPSKRSIGNSRNCLLE